jgi:hypothetical protein
VADDILVVVEPPPPEIVVFVDAPPADVLVTVSTVALAGPPGDPTVLLEQLEPPVDLTLLFENALS